MFFYMVVFKLFNEIYKIIINMNEIFVVFNEMCMVWLNWLFEGYLLIGYVCFFFGWFFGNVELKSLMLEYLFNF